MSAATSPAPRAGRQKPLLYSYWRSSTAYRVRIALNLKHVPFQVEEVDLLGGAQNAASYRALSPVGGVPTLVLPDGKVFIQSLAILTWLDRAYPEPWLMPEDPFKAAQVQAAALTIATDIHPVNNLKVVQRIATMGHDRDEIAGWMNHWMGIGLAAFQQQLPDGTPFCFGDAPGLADVCLVPQMYNARRWGLDLEPLPRLVAIEARCLALETFDAARPRDPQAGPSRGSGQQEGGAAADT